MFRPIFTFEVKYQLRRPATWLYFVILFLLAFGFLSSDAVEIGGGRGKVLKNAPWVLASVTGILTAIGQVITSALVGTAILRDFQHRTHELLFTTAMSRVGYLAGRFCGAFVAMALVYLAIPIGALAGSVMPWLDPEKMLPIRLAAYFQPFVVIGLVNVLAISALFFVAGALTRSQFVVYTMGIFLLVANTITQHLTNDLRNEWIAALVDPFALQTFELTTRYWTVAEKNTRLVPLESYLLWNRVLWVAIAGVLVAVTLWAFRFSAQPVAIGWGRRRRAQLAAQAAIGEDGPSATTSRRSTPVPECAMRDAHSTRIAHGVMRQSHPAMPHGDAQCAWFAQHVMRIRGMRCRAALPAARRDGGRQTGAQSPLAPSRPGP